MDADKEREYREEAERLATIPVEDQIAVLDIYRSCAENTKLPRRARELNRERIEALERHLRRLNRAKKTPKR